jgi:archaellum component FlaC
MPGDITRQEFESRVAVLEREVEGEKMVTRHILEQTRRNGDDIAAVKTRLDRIDLKIDGVEFKVDAVDLNINGVRESLGARIDGLAAKLDGLIRSLPKIVGDSVRDVLNGRAG